MYTEIKRLVSEFHHQDRICVPHNYELIYELERHLRSENAVFTTEYVDGAWYFVNLHKLV